MYKIYLVPNKFVWDKGFLKFIVKLEKLLESSLHRTKARIDTYNTITYHEIGRKPLFGFSLYVEKGSDYFNLMYYVIAILDLSSYFGYKTKTIHGTGSSNKYDLLILFE